MPKKIDKLVSDHQEARDFGEAFDAVHIRNEARRVLNEKEYAEFERRIF